MPQGHIRITPTSIIDILLTLANDANSLVRFVRTGAYPGLELCVQKSSPFIRLIHALCVKIANRRHNPRMEQVASAWQHDQVKIGANLESSHLSNLAGEQMPHNVMPLTSPPRGPFDRYFLPEEFPQTGD